MSIDIGLKDEMVYKYQVEKYRHKLKSIIYSLNSDNDEIESFVCRIISVKSEEYNKLTDQLFSEIIYNVLDIVSIRLDQPVNVFIKNLYQYFSEQMSDEESETFKSNLKNYIKLSEAYATAYMEKRITNNEERVKSISDLAAIKHIEDLLLKYRVISKKDINVILLKRNFIYFLFKTMILLVTLSSLVNNPTVLTDKIKILSNLNYPVTYYLYLIGFILFIVFIIRLAITKNRFNTINLLLRNTCQIGQIAQSDVYDSLKKKMGKNVKYFL